MQESSTFPVRKLLSAIVAVAIALAGVLLGFRWLTVAALVVWIIAMMVFGPGQRGRQTRKG